MGGHYARLAKEPDAVAEAIAEQYDAVSSTKPGLALALADRLDSLVGIFAIGQQPSGDKDPFALRRAALGLIRICIERRLDLDIEQLLNTAAQTFEAKVNAAAAVNTVFDYVMDRLRGYYQELGVESDIVDAVLVTRPTRPLDFDRRVQACRVFRDLPEAQSLAAANKRICNILKKWDRAIPAVVDQQRLVDAAEKQLAEQLTSVSKAVLPLMERGDYTPALKQLAALKEPVDAFFDSVMVMADDTALRDNRLALLQSLGNLFLRVADLSRLQS
jgi:glycyl-tRNA synthetase beta chain